VYYKLAEDSGTGVFPVTFAEYLPEQSPDPWWKSAVRDFRRVNPAEIPSIYKDGYLFEVPFVDTSVYMPWLLSRFKQLGGTIHQKELFSLEETNADLVVNCSGLGARFLANDPEVYPVRGQGIRVKAKNNGGCFLDQQSELALCYVFPRTNDVILGGTAQEHHYQSDPDPSTTEEILRKVKIMDPSLEIEKVIETVVGLRPARFEVRLEVDKNTPLPVIHNYGHGGAGFTLSWGCAEDVVNLAKSFKKVKSQF
jgi:D-amino-acid oxidase